MRKMRGDLGAQTHTRARSTYGKVASSAGLNVFEHCKRLERDLPSSSRCLANFQRVLKAIDKQVCLRQLRQNVTRVKCILTVALGCPSFVGPRAGGST